ncbi:MAG: acyl-CoA dehydrogenase family protein [Caulobacteraceae bacterium]|nr:acyl-CoA dehydrogenase family protein [Caulobacteraceae bacterium]
MNFDWTPSQNSFRQRIRDVLDRELQDDWPQKSRLDPSSEYVSRFSREFCPTLAREGLLIPHWPQQDGGEGLDPFHHWILGEEMFAIGEPRSYQYMSVNWAGPAIRKYGTPRQKAELLPRITGGTMIFCQGFSEPGAGSDLAAMKTKAERSESGGFVINGSKIWTSGASLADVCFLLARTGQGRKDISAFLVPMDTPGIDVRIVASFNGERSFHEVFFTDVQAPEDAVLGEVGRGWDIVMSVLADERVGAPRYALTMRGIDIGVGILAGRGQFDEPAQIRAAQAMAACHAAQLLCLSVIDDRAKGRPPSGSTSVARYCLNAADRLAADFFEEFLSDDLVLNENPVLAAAYRRTASSGIASGTAEMQMNAIARDVLRLPRE